MQNICKFAQKCAKFENIANGLVIACDNHMQQTARKGHSYHKET